MDQQNFLYANEAFCINSGYLLREIAGEYVIIPVDEECMVSNAVMTPNETAVFIWKAFQQPSTIEEVVQQGIQEYDAPEDIIRKAVHQFVEDALLYKILERAN